MIGISGSLGKIREPVRVTNIDMKRSSHPREELFYRVLYIVFKLNKRQFLLKIQLFIKFVLI